METIIIRQWQAFDGTILVTYEDKTGYQNTVPMWVYRKIKKSIKNK
jgi:hypothetical protein